MSKLWYGKQTVQPGVVRDKVVASWRQLRCPVYLEMKNPETGEWFVKMLRAAPVDEHEPFGCPVVLSEGSDYTRLHSSVDTRGLLRRYHLLVTPDEETQLEYLRPGQRITLVDRLDFNRRYTFVPSVIRQ